MKFDSFPGVARQFTEVTLLGFTAEQALVLKLPGVTVKWMDASPPRVESAKVNALPGLDVQEVPMGRPPRVSLIVPVRNVNDLLLLLHRRRGYRDTDSAPLTATNFEKMRHSGLTKQGSAAPLALAFPQDGLKVRMAHFHAARTGTMLAQVKDERVTHISVELELFENPFTDFDPMLGHTGFSDTRDLRSVQDQPVVLPESSAANDA